MKNDFFTYSCRKIEKDKAAGRCDVANNRDATLKCLSKFLGKEELTFGELSPEMMTQFKMVKSQWTQGINRPSLFVPDSYPLQRSGERSHCPTSAVAEWHKVAFAIQTEVRVAYGGRIAQNALCRPIRLHVTDICP